MKALSAFSRVALAGTVAAVGGLALLQHIPGANGAINAKHPVLTIDLHEIMTQSKLGQDIHRQLNAYEGKIEADLGAEGQSLQNERQAFSQQSASLPTAARDKKTRDLQARETAYRQKLQARQSLVQGGELAARKYYLAELAVVVQSILAERGADAVVQKSSIVASVNGLDITQDVIQRLDRKDANFKVPLVNPPATSDIQMMH